MENGRSRGLYSPRLLIDIYHDCLSIPNPVPYLTIMAEAAIMAVSQDRLSHTPGGGQMDGTRELQTPRPLAPIRRPLRREPAHTPPLESAGSDASGPAWGSPTARTQDWLGPLDHGRHRRVGISSSVPPALRTSIALASIGTAQRTPGASRSTLDSGPASSNRNHPDSPTDPRMHTDLALHRLSHRRKSRRV